MKLRKQYQDQVEAFTKVCHHLAHNMYVTGYGGDAL